MENEKQEISGTAGGRWSAIDEAVPAGPVQKAEPLAGGLKPTMNRETRRKLAAYEKSAKWKRLLTNSQKAAVRKLNRLAAEARARAAMPDPED